MFLISEVPLYEPSTWMHRTFIEASLHSVGIWALRAHKEARLCGVQCRFTRYPRSHFHFSATVQVLGDRLRAKKEHFRRVQGFLLESQGQNLA